MSHDYRVHSLLNDLLDKKPSAGMQLISLQEKAKIKSESSKITTILTKTSLLDAQKENVLNRKYQRELAAYRFLGKKPINKKETIPRHPNNHYAFPPY